MCEHPKEGNVGSFFSQKVGHNRHLQSQDWVLSQKKSCGLSFIRLKQNKTTTKPKQQKEGQAFSWHRDWLNFPAPSTLCPCCYYSSIPLCCSLSVYMFFSLLNSEFFGG